MLDMFIPITPVAKGRPRFLGKGKVYTPQETLVAERSIKILVKNEMSKQQIALTEDMVCLKMIFYYALPRKLSERDRLLADMDMLYKATRPDIDNLAKLVCDALNGILYKDDNQVVKLICEKKYHTTDGIRLKALKI